jgi:hypothetical protein
MKELRLNFGVKGSQNFTNPIGAGSEIYIFVSVHGQGSVEKKEIVPNLLEQNIADICCFAQFVKSDKSNNGQRTWGVKHEDNTGDEGYKKKQTGSGTRIVFRRP